ncbi:hypothetical protein AB0884_35160, partial [Streptomyces sp. NPDC005283]
LVTLPAPQPGPSPPLPLPTPRPRPTHAVAVLAETLARIEETKGIGVNDVELRNLPEFAVPDADN